MMLFCAIKVTHRNAKIKIWRCFCSKTLFSCIRRCFRVSGVDSILDGLMARQGLYGAHTPDDLANSDLDRGLEVVRAIGGMDVGQAVVGQQGMVLGIEGVEGTDALIMRCGELKKEGPGGVLVKINMKISSSLRQLSYFFSKEKLLRLLPTSLILPRLILLVSN